MNNKIVVVLILFCSFIFSKQAMAANYSHLISLSPGWNLISTPRIVESHQFSAPETLANFSIYLQSSTSTSGWKTMSEVGQTEFTPLYGYFIYNNTGTNQTLTLNYKQSNTPAARMFSRSLSVGWNVLGVANPSYALKQFDEDGIDSDNVSNILNSISPSTAYVLDATATSTSKSGVAVSQNWEQRVFSQANQLDDLRETKAYIAYLNGAAIYNGFQNDSEISTSTTYVVIPPVSASSTLSLTQPNYSYDPNPRYTLDSQELDVQDIYFEARNGTSTVTELTTTIDSSASTSVSVVQLKEGNTIVGVATLVGTSITFSNLSITIPNNGSKYLRIIYFLKAIKPGSAVSGAKIQSTITGYRALSATSEAITQANEAGFTSKTGNAWYLLKSMLYLGTNNLPFRALTGGRQTISAFRISPSGTKDTSWKKISFNVTKSANLIFGLASTTKLYSNNNAEIPGTVYYEGDSLIATNTINTLNHGKIIFVADNEQVISNEVAYLLKADLSGSLVASDYLGTNIADGSTWASPSPYGSVVGNFIWSDMSAISHSATSTDWYNEYFPDFHFSNQEQFMMPGLFSGYGYADILKSDSSATGTVMVNSKGVSLGKFTIAARNEPIKINTLKFGFQNNITDVSALENGKVFINGEQVGTTTNLNATGTDYVINRIVQAENPITIEIVADIKDVNNVNLIGVNSERYIYAVIMPSTNNVEGVYSDLLSSAPNNSWSVNANYLTVVASTTMDITRNDGYSTARHIASGVNDITLGKFAVKANYDSISIKSVSLSANLGTMPDTSIYDMKLFVDGSQVGSTRDFSSTGTVFSSLNINISKDETKVLELKGSFDSVANGTFQTVLNFDAQDSHSITITKDVLATTTDFIIVNGSLNAELGGNTPAAGMLASKNSVEQEVAQFKFTAINDDAILTELNIINIASGTINSIASTTAGVSTADARIAAVKLYDGATLIDSFVPVSGAGKFTITNNAVTVLANQSKTLSIKVVLNNINNDAAATDKDIRLGATTLKFKSSNGTENTQGANGANGILANNFRARKTVPTVALAALPTTVLTAGDQVISKFTVTADANGDVSMHKIILTTSNSANATITPLTVSSTIKVNGSYKTIASVATTSSTMIITFATDEVVSASSSKTFEVLASLSVSGPGSESVVTRISEDSSYSTDGNFVWSDGASVSTPTYSNGYRVPGLTTTTQVLSK